jgi:hypothetical protein
VENPSQQPYRIRAYKVGALGFLSQADHYDDFTLESTAELEEFAKALAITGFKHPHKPRWIMPSAIIWVEIA